MDLQPARALARDPAAARLVTDRIRTEYERIGMRLGEGLLPFPLGVHLLTEEQDALIAGSAERMWRILEKVCAACLRDPRFSGLGLIEDELSSLDHRYAAMNVLARFDAFFDGRQLRFLEFNCCSPSGMGRVPHIERIFRSALGPQAEALREGRDSREAVARAIEATHEEWSGARSGKLRIAFADWEWAKTRCDQEYLAERLCARGHDAFLCSPSDFSYEGGALLHEGERVDILVKRALPRELLERKGACVPLFDALRAGAVCVINPFSSAIASDKRTLAHLSAGTFDGLLDEDERALVRAVIPWTREAKTGAVRGPDGEEVDLEGFARANRSRLVLKPAGGYGGAGVCLGLLVDDDAWGGAVEKAFAEGAWVFQDHIDPPTIDLPAEGLEPTAHFMTIAPFLIAGEASGYFTRYSRSPIINTSGGGGIIPSFVVKSASLAGTNINLAASRSP